MSIATITRSAWAGSAVLLAVVFTFSAGLAGAAEGKKFIVYGDKSLPPYEFVRDGAPQGAMVDLVQALAERMGRTPEIHLKKWSESQEAVQSGAGDALSIMGKTKEREEKYDFSDETFQITFSLFVLADAQERYDSRKLAGLRIGVTEGGLPQTFLRENHPEAALVVIEDNADGVRRVLRREIDALAANTWSGQHFLSELNISGIGIATPPLVARSSAMAIPKGHPELLAEINAALRALKQDGTFDRIIDNWSSRKVYVLSQREMSRASWLAGAGILLLLLTGGFVWAFRGQRNALAAEVNERRRSEAALRKSEEKYRSLFSNMDEAFALGELIYDVHGVPIDFRLLEANDAFYRETGLPEGILNRPAREFVPELEQYWLDAYHRVVTTGVSVRMENTNVDTQRHYDLCAFRPSPGRFAIAFRDITENVRIEKALRESDRNLRELIATLPGMVWVCAPDGAVEFMSQQWLDYTGTTLESQLGEGAFEPIHPQDRGHVAEQWAEAIEARTPFHVEYRLRRHDGIYRWFKSRGRPLFDADGRVGRWLGVVIDIDDRKQVEHALSEERDRAQGYLQVAGVMLLVLDLEGRIATINRRGAEILGYSDERALIGRNWFEFAVPAELRAKIHGVFAEVLANNPDFAVQENVIVRADGSERWISWRNVVLRDAEGRITGTLSSGEDITERRQAEALLARDKAELERLVQDKTNQLVQAQKMEAIGRLTGGIAHDFNNVLQGLGSCLFVLERYVPDGRPRDLFGAAQQSIETGARLTKSLLAFARRQTLAPEAVDLPELFDDIRPLLERTLGGMIRLTAEVEPGVPPALVDRGQLESAILNLAINSRDAMPTGGELILRAKAVEVGPNAQCVPELAAGEYVAVFVEDNGSGIDEETLRHVFEPFFTTKEFGKGSGLGLSMVHGMAAQSGGSVTIASRRGQGTTVTLYLPRANSVQQAAPVSRPAVETGGGRTLLLVDDNHLMRDALKITLESLDYHVFAVAGGKAALSILREGNHVDALVTDYAMPDMNGAELVREARLIVPGLPALLVTGHAERLADVRQVLLLHKPFQTEDLIAALAALAERRAVRGGDATEAVR